MGKDSIELLRNTLLVMLLLLLAWVLYRRMLILMGKSEIRKRYIFFSEDCASRIAEHRKVRIESESIIETHLEVFTAEGRPAGSVFQGKIEPGTHDFPLPENLAGGRYYIQLSTSNQTDSLFFNLN